MMILYHGTDERSAKIIASEGIDLYAGSLHTDFGPGFYTTPDADLAQIWAHRKGMFSRGAIVSYKVEENELKKLKVRTFEETDFAWAQFVANNRNGYRYVRLMTMQENNLTGQYDVVIGQIADGKVSDITRHLQQTHSAVDIEALRGLTQRQYAPQYSFHTARGIRLLQNPRVKLL